MAGAVIGDAPTWVVVAVGVLATLALILAKRGLQRSQILGAIATAAAFGPRLRLLAVTAAAGLALIAAYSLGLRREGVRNGQRAETLLLKLLVPELRDLCKSSGSLPKGALAQVACRDGAANITATFTRFGSSAVLKQEIDRAKASVAAPPGRCFRQTTAVGTYSLKDAPNAGVLLCDAQGRRQSISWSNDKLLIFAEAQQDGKRSPALLQWWSDRNAALTSSALRRPFPDELERRLLADVPVSLRNSCKRDPYSVKGSEATVKCSPSTGADNVWYLRLEDNATRTRRLTQAAKALRNVERACSVQGSDPGIQNYADGRWVCYDEEGMSWVEWSDDKSLIYAYARRQPRNLRSLVLWWRGHI